MNQPEIPVSNAPAPLHQCKGQLLNKGYSYQEVKEENAVISIFKVSAAGSIQELVALPGPTSN